MEKKLYSRKIGTDQFGDVKMLTGKLKSDLNYSAHEFEGYAQQQN